MSPDIDIFLHCPYESLYRETITNNVHVCRKANLVTIGKVMLTCCLTASCNGRRGLTAARAAAVGRAERTTGREKKK